MLTNFMFYLRIETEPSMIHIFIRVFWLLEPQQQRTRGEKKLIKTQHCMFRAFIVINISLFSCCRSFPFTFGGRSKSVLTVFLDLTIALSPLSTRLSLQPFVEELFVIISCQCCPSRTLSFMKSRSGKKRLVGCAREIKTKELCSRLIICQNEVNKSHSGLRSRHRFRWKAILASCLFKFQFFSGLQWMSGWRKSAQVLFLMESFSSLLRWKQPIVCVV